VEVNISNHDTPSTSTASVSALRESDKDCVVTEPKQFALKDIRTLRGIDAVLGRGRYGVVLQCYLPALDSVAIKCAMLYGSGREIREAGSNVLEEVKILSRIQHPNLIRMLGTTEGDLWLGVIMELMYGGTLHDLLKDKAVTIPYILRTCFCFDITNGISYLHKFDTDGQKRMTHGDLKALNVMLDKNLICKICDFGTAKLADLTGQTTILSNNGVKVPYTPAYAAPERLKDPYTRPTTSMDIFSIGVIFKFIITRDAPTLPFRLLDKNAHKPGNDEFKFYKLLSDMHELACSEKACDRPPISHFQSELSRRVARIDAKKRSSCTAKVLQKYKVTPFNSSQDFIIPFGSAVKDYLLPSSTHSNN